MPAIPATLYQTPQRLPTRFKVISLLKGFLFYRSLYVIHGFDKWHLFGNYEARPYKQVVVMAANAVNPRHVVEVGCGLGEIIRRIKGYRKIGIDIDPSVIKGAKILSIFNNVEFIVGSIKNVAHIEGDEIDLLVMVNWPHEHSSTELQIALKELFTLKVIKNIVVDEINDTADGYMYKHDYSLILPRQYYLISRLLDNEGYRVIKTYALCSRDDL
jgi:SAM-dependent methyltransferase